MSELIHCPNCGKENEKHFVKKGVCFWCGYDRNYQEAVEAWNNLLDIIAKELHLYQLNDWLESKLKRWFK